MYVYVNGKIVHSEEANISVFDHGFMYGLGVFETFRVYNGHPFLLDDHFQRLQESLAMLDVHWSYQKQDVLTILEQLLEANQLRDAYVRWNVSAGRGPLGLQAQGYEEPTVIAYMKPIQTTIETVEKDAVILGTRRNSPEGEKRLKSHHFLNNILGKRELGTRVNTEGIFLTNDDYLAEGIVSNLFWVKEGTLYTPAVETGILDGVTRQFILTLAHTDGIKCKTGFYDLDDLLSCDEAFITNSIQEIVPLKMIDSYLLPGKEGEVTKGFLQRYQQVTAQLWSRKELR
ncbi:aminodeoxychorismate lyase [Desertibacillus haloalkaliphilus]|uniref:aminodeoxychorismate lyase n=1 Tax=Desertibacillus haloalkaliphilus TaxID=1328930 RepID=UPI001C2664A6|nr:aminodeoxychorismate lyase [Desertibacillus haloalkaliphilus]MBU8908455.1 aminodeoxychorismate lyase [Desertibacillus haloalkaliphilus]